MWTVAPTELRVWAGLVVAASLLAYATANHDPLRFALIFATALLLFAFITRGVVRVVSRWRLANRTNQQVEQALAEIRALSPAEARSRALQLLAGDRFSVTRSSASADDLAKLAPMLQEFFSEFATVAEAHGETRIARSEIGPSRFRAGYLRIGTDMENMEIVVSPDCDTVFVIDALLREDPLPEEGFPTIYHFIAAGHSHATAIET